MEELTRKGDKTEEGGRQKGRAQRKFEEVWALMKETNGERSGVKEATKTARKEAPYQENSYSFFSQERLQSLPLLGFKCSQCTQ